MDLGDIRHVNIRRLGELLITITGSHGPGGHKTCEQKEAGGTVDHNNRLSRTWGDIRHVNIRRLGELLTTITGSHGPRGT